MHTPAKQLETALIAVLDSTENGPAAVIGMLRVIAIDRMHETSRSLAERQAWSAWEHKLAQLNTSSMPNPFAGPWQEVG